ncbi:putative lipid-transfer protein DIR1 [Carex littledalei]|uniref:Putative lipid-transfer protein DIR1 n=1 Tax=Carex littledalei TaxID=544730 RepID=A0A833VML9_9POAL|nr:putative lipid-transfer protein DIR1 [Carex littledalei]
MEWRLYSHGRDEGLGMDSILNNSMVSALSLCGMNNDGIIACLPSVRGSNLPHPTSKCCRAARGANFRCFCSYQHSVLIRLLGVNVNQIRKLPAKCGIARRLYC